MRCWCVARGVEGRGRWTAGHGGDDRRYFLSQLEAERALYQILLYDYAASDCRTPTVVPGLDLR
jgi:hypothetical protein